MCRCGQYEDSWWQDKPSLTIRPDKPVVQRIVKKNKIDVEKLKEAIANIALINVTKGDRLDQLSKYKALMLLNELIKDGDQ